MDDGDAERRGSKRVTVWVNNAADLAAMIWAGCRLAAAVKRHGDGTRRTKHCDGNVGALDPSDLPGWITFWVDGEGQSELVALNRLGYGAGTFGRDPAGERPSSEAAAAGRASEVAEEVSRAAAPPEKVVRDDDDDGRAAPPQEEAVDATAGGRGPMRCATFTSEMLCCGSCSIM